MRRLLSLLGPGIFAIGYTIGTGSVTSMAAAGGSSGLQMLWVLALSCLFSGVLMDAYGRFAVVTGETALHGVRRFLPGGKVWAWLIFAGVVLGQWTCLGGILTLSSSAIVETVTLFVPGFGGGGRLATVGVAGLIIAVMVAVMMIGRYSFFEKLLSVFVAVMAITFCVSMFVTFPDARTVARTIVPQLPREPESLLMLAAFVGTTMAAPTFVTRPLILTEKKMSVSDLPRERLDAAVSATLMFVISGAIVAVAAGAIYALGKPPVTRVLDMAGTLEPLAGRFAVALFMAGIVSAGLSSIFPILMVAPLLLSDMESGKLDLRSRRFRTLAVIAALLAMTVPALGGNPVAVTVLAQISNVFALPLAVSAIILLGFRAPMGAHRPGVVQTALLGLAFLFSLAVAAAAILALIRN